MAKSGQSLGARVRNTAFSALVYLFLYAPIAVIVLFSFNTSRRNIVFEGFTLDWYGVMAGNTQLMDSLVNTLIVASCSTLLSVIIGSLAAVGMYRYRFRGRAAIDALLYIPVVIPEVVLGIALLSVFSLANVPLGLLSMIIAHATFSIPFVVFTVRARLSGFDASTEEAAMDLGANRLQVFSRITVPLIAPGIGAGAMLAFTLSIDDIIISFFTTGATSMTFPLKVMEMVRSGVSPDVYALSTIIILVTFAVVVTSQAIRYRHQKGQEHTGT
ncbi:MAG: ABC transporter permease [Coriobacteriales bacterium]|jgi:spermidine/putrescine transport system permease protein|nr:ABC transporter permease [Coriobacteriales bacterium]